MEPSMDASLTVESRAVKCVQLDMNLLLASHLSANRARQDLWPCCLVWAEKANRHRRPSHEVVLQVGTNQLMSPSHPEDLEYCCVPALDHEVGLVDYPAEEEQDMLRVNSYGPHRPL